MSSLCLTAGFFNWATLCININGHLVSFIKWSFRADFVCFTAYGFGNARNVNELIEGRTCFFNFGAEDTVYLDGDVFFLENGNVVFYYLLGKQIDWGLACGVY
jgi:hypothetical protein